MATRWAYHAVDAAGRRVRGAEESTDPGQLARTLERRGLLLLSADADRPADDRSAGTRGSASQVLEVTRALAALLPAGLPLSRALAAAAQLVNPRTAAVLTQVQHGVERGDALADALARHPAFFSPFYTGVVRAGERSGDLDGAFARLATQLERDERVRSRLLSAAIYPAILLVAGGIAVVVLLLFVIPRFAQLLEGAGARLPASTAALLWVAGTVRSGWPALLAALGAGLAAAAGALRSAAGRRAAARAALAIPGLRALRREQLAARSARLMSVLLKGGAPLLAALDDAAATIGDPVAAAELERVRGRIREGASLQLALGESSRACFPRCCGSSWPSARNPGGSRNSWPRPPTCSRSGASVRSSGWSRCSSPP
jgi:type II secretory pathway component PulF